MYAAPNLEYTPWLHEAWRSVDVARACAGTNGMQLMAAAPWFQALEELDVDCLALGGIGDLRGLAAPRLARLGVHLSCIPFQCHADDDLAAALGALALPALLQLDVQDQNGNGRPYHPSYRCIAGDLKPAGFAALLAAPGLGASAGAAAEDPESCHVHQMSAARR